MQSQEICETVSKWIDLPWDKWKFFFLDSFFDGLFFSHITDRPDSKGSHFKISTFVFVNPLLDKFQSPTATTVDLTLDGEYWSVFFSVTHVGGANRRTAQADVSFVWGYQPLIRQNNKIPPASCRHHLFILNNPLQDLWSWLLLSMNESILQMLHQDDGLNVFQVLWWLLQSILIVILRRLLIKLQTRQLR